MKKVLFAMAIAGMFGFAACNNNKAAEEPIADTTVETVAQECCEMTDSTAVEAAAEETAEVATEAAAQ